MEGAIFLDLSTFPLRPEYLLRVVGALAGVGLKLLVVDWGDCFPWSWDRHDPPWRYTEELVAAVCRTASTSGLRVAARLPFLDRADSVLGAAEYRSIRRHPESSSLADPGAVGFSRFVDDVVEDVLSLCPSMWGLAFGEDYCERSGASRSSERPIADAIARSGVVPLVFRDSLRDLSVCSRNGGAERLSETAGKGSTVGDTRKRWVFGGADHDRPFSQDPVIYVPRPSFEHALQNDQPAAPAAFAEHVLLLLCGSGESGVRAALAGEPGEFARRLSELWSAREEAWGAIITLSEILAEMAHDPRRRAARILRVQRLLEQLDSLSRVLHVRGEALIAAGRDSTDASWMRLWLHSIESPVREQAALLRARLESLFVEGGGFA